MRAKRAWAIGTLDKIVWNSALRPEPNPMGRNVETVNDVITEVSTPAIEDDVDFQEEIAQLKGRGVAYVKVPPRIN